MRYRRQMLITEATVACLAVVASLCVADTAKADISSGPGWVGAVIAIKDVTITSTITSDAIVTPYKEDMLSLCTGEHCVFYKGYCDNNKHRTNCSLWYLPEKSSQLRRIEIIGRRKSVFLILDRLKLVVSPGPMIPLSTFRYDAQNDSPPTCYARRGCTAN
jgi:hypothetical protein